VRPGHKSGSAQQRRDALSSRQIVLMGIEHDQLLEGNGSQGQQLRPLYALDGHRHAPLKAMLAQAMEGVHGL
jgi:hypothetical protein